MRQEIIDFIHGFSESFIYGLKKHQIVEEDLEKSKMKLFTVSISVTIFVAGILITIWGIAFYIDKVFNMQGLGFILVGIIATLVGLLLYKT